MLGIAKDMGVDIHKRDELYATSNCTGTDLNVYLAKAVETEFFFFLSIMTPFIPNKYEECINIFKDIVTSNKYDSLNTFNISQHFTWNDTKPINYQYNNEVPSFQLPKWYIPNFGINIIETKNVIKYKNIIGKKPYFYQTDLIQGIDIDYPCDFIISELLYNHNIVNEETADLIIKKRDNDKIELLDCTIRDGGYLHNWDYSFEQVNDCYEAVTKAGYTYFEIGFKADKNIVKNKGRWYYSLEENVKIVKDSQVNGCNIAVLVKPGDIDINNIPPKNISSIDLYRVLVNRTNKKMDKDFSFYTLENIMESCNLANILIGKGYKVTINIGCFDIVTDTEIKILSKNITSIIGLECVYLADTYGSGNIKNISIQLHKFYTEFNKYKSNIPFGFHCHNNNEDALGKTTTAIYHGCTMIDSCIGGLGRGAGNLKSEVLVSYLYNNTSEYIKRITPLIIYFDKHIISKTEYQQNYYIQSHPYYRISGTMSLHPNYILEILNMNTDIITDIKLIVKLNKYTKKHNERNYNKTLIKNFLKD